MALLPTEHTRPLSCLCHPFRRSSSGPSAGRLFVPSSSPPLLSVLQLSNPVPIVLSYPLPVKAGWLDSTGWTGLDWTGRNGMLTGFLISTTLLISNLVLLSRLSLRLSLCCCTLFQSLPTFLDHALTTGYLDQLLSTSPVRTLGLLQEISRTLFSGCRPTRKRLVIALVLANG